MIYKPSNSGLITKTLVENPATGYDGKNYWINWATQFVSFCKETLKLEVQAGPGTSIGRYHKEYGPSRYQYDCDWNRPFGRVDNDGAFWCQERGYTLWSDSEEGLWSQLTPINGIDTKNSRFDFIVWFTQSQGENGNRIGLRFKYPITNERGYYCAYLISAAPAVMPWCESNDDINNIRLNDNWGVNPTSRTGTVSYNTDKANYSFKLLGNYNVGGNVTKVFDSTTTNILWSQLYQSNMPEGEDYIPFTSLGGDFLATGAASLDAIATSNPSKVVCVVSTNKKVVNLKLLDETPNDSTKEYSGDTLIDILYGDLMEEDSGGIVNSFVEVKINNGYFDNFLLTTNFIYDNVNDEINYDYHYNVNTSLQINRPTSGQKSAYWGISRLLLEKEVKHCEELYQVFSFNDFLNTDLMRQIVFQDSNGKLKYFIVINYGIRQTTSLYGNTVLLAIPIQDIS